jgi:hypothetical protein
LRHKNANWNLPEKLTDWSQASVAVLMDIHDELKTTNYELRNLNRIFGCRNFLRIPRKLDAIRLNTAVKRKRKAKGAE